MSWLPLPDDQSSPLLTRLTRPWREEGRPVAHVMAVLKLNPSAMRSVFQMNNAVTFGGSTLGRRTEELISTQVSALNDCFY